MTYINMFSLAWRDYKDQFTWYVGECYLYCTTFYKMFHF